MGWWREVRAAVRCCGEWSKYRAYGSRGRGERGRIVAPADRRDSGGSRVATRLQARGLDTAEREHGKPQPAHAGEAL